MGFVHFVKMGGLLLNTFYMFILVMDAILYIVFFFGGGLS